MRTSRFDRHAPAAPWRALALVPMLLALAGVAHAQTDDGDPPDRVARLSYLAGDIGLLPGGAQDWSNASVNRPLTTGDRLAAGENSRAELELDRAALRLDRDTDVGVLRLDDRVAQFELTRGTVNLTVRALAPGESYEIDTPRVALEMDQPGTFRIDVDARDGDTEITAFDGQAVVYGADQASRRLVGGHTYRFDDSSLARVDESYAGSRDGFDTWCADRDQRYADAQSGRYVSEQVIGYQDLDDYGRWQDDDQYGAVWYPSDVSAGWAPYRFGHWAYVAPWGWTWIDDAPWGFAPYHYGRWVYVRDRWGWIPGPRDLRPVYAPALVAFVGGRGWSASVGAGPPIGWFPLGPGDFYDPWYRVSIGYYRRVNWHDRDDDWDRRRDHDRRGDHDRREANERYFNERWQRYHEGRDPPLQFAHERPPHGITAMSREAFAEARPVQAHRLRLDASEMRDATLLGRAGQLPAARRPAPAGRPPAPRGVETRAFQRPVVTHRPAAGAGPDRDGAWRADRPAGPAPGRIAMPPATTRTPSPRFASEHTDQPGPARRDEPRRITGTLPTVPRFVHAPVAPRQEPVIRREYATPVPQPRALPVPPRLEPIGNVPPETRRWPRAEPRIVQAPSERPATRPEPPPARFETRSPVMNDVPPPRRVEPMPRAYAPQPQPRPQPPPPPPPRQFAPPPRPAHAAPVPNRQPPEKERENPGAKRFQHR
ncbi:MAG: hypothetical protein KGN77_09665 [Xanthomonadaceae bacterium]|nr:hypothetical protein [Xanthomonadaceae bacterium]MDE1962541.1 hypothetical protein [Xanthomonadaceae bacterium]